MQETQFLVHRTQPLLLPANKEGYTVLASCQCPEDLPSLAWRLNLLSQHPLQGLTQLPCSRQDVFEGGQQCQVCSCMLPACHVCPHCCAVQHQH